MQVDVTIDLTQRNILIKDTAGGVAEGALKKLISPGETSLMGDTASIGIFGVGSKRAVVALAELIQITTRYHNKKRFFLSTMIAGFAILIGISLFIPYPISIPARPRSSYRICVLL